MHGLCVLTCTSVEGGCRAVSAACVSFSQRLAIDEVRPTSRCAAWLCKPVTWGCEHGSSAIQPTSSAAGHAGGGVQWPHILSPTESCAQGLRMMVLHNCPDLAPLHVQSSQRAVIQCCVGRLRLCFMQQHCCMLTWGARLASAASALVGKYRSCIWPTFRCAVLQQAHHST